MATEKEILSRVKNKRDTSANWTTHNPVILNGEIIIVDTAEGEVRFKIGDGIKTYTQLPFEDEAVRNLIDTKIAAIPTPDVSGQISTHNTNEAAHPYIQGLITNLESAMELAVNDLDERINAIDYPVDSVNGKTGAVVLGVADISGAASKTYVDEAIEAIPTPDVSGQIADHNEDSEAHPYVLDLINTLDTRVDAVVDNQGNLVGAAATAASQASDTSSKLDNYFSFTGSGAYMGYGSNKVYATSGNAGIQSSSAQLYVSGSTLYLSGINNTSGAAIAGLATETFTDNQIAAHDADEAAHPYIQNRIDVLESDLDAAIDDLNNTIGEIVFPVDSVNGKTGTVVLAVGDISGAASTTYVDNKVAELVDSSPDALNTLNELAAALGDDPNFATTVANQIGAIETAVENTNTRIDPINADLYEHIVNYNNPHKVTAAQVNAYTKEETDNVIGAIKYAISPTLGGPATSANKLNTNDGSATQPVYFANGIPVATTYALNKTVPADAVFTDAQVTAVGNHYAPAADTAAALSVDASSTTAATWGTTSLVTGVNLQRDAKGHVVGVTVDSIKMPANPDTNTTYSAGTGISLSGTTFSNSGVRSIATGSANGTISVNTNGTSEEVAVKGLGSNAYTSTAYVPTSTTVNSKALTGNITLSASDVSALPITGGTITGTTASTSTTTGALIIQGGLGVAGAIYGGTVHGAVWNDYAEFRQSDVLEPGRVVCENGDDTLNLSTERLQPGANIISDTYGFSIGETDECQTPIAVSGRVLAYTYEDRNSYKPGDAVCAAPGGTVSKMTREEIREYPERIIGTVSAIPTYETWGTGDVAVNGRIWIKIK